VATLKRRKAVLGCDTEFGVFWLLVLFVKCVEFIFSFLGFLSVFAGGMLYVFPWCCLFWQSVVWFLFLMFGLAIFHPSWCLMVRCGTCRVSVQWVFLGVVIF
jgi:hypothetical protein